MAKTKVLITVKTYPTISSKYDELVCTAGFKEDGTWIRIYPIPFRKKSYEEQYKKYEWIELDLVKNESDFRPESYRPYSFDSEIKVIEKIGTENNWNKRKEIVLTKVYNNISQLKSEAKDKKICTSLAVFKPTKIKDFIIEEVDRVWDQNKIRKLKVKSEQLNFFENTENPFKVVRKLPYKFSYIFEDSQGTKSTMMIEDWEIGALYWKLISKYKGDEVKAIEDVKLKYFEDFAKTKDLYFYLGTTQLHHFVSRNPFIIIGTFHPKIDKQTRIF